MVLQPTMRVVVCAALVGLVIAGAGLFPTQPVAGQESRPAALRGAAALDQLKQDGQYEALQTALNQARFTVSRAEATPLGRMAWHAPNPAAGYDAYVTEAGVSIVVDDRTVVSLSLHSLGYGAAMQGVAPGEVSGERQTINLTRDNGVMEWYVNGPDGLEQGFTLAEPPGARRQGAPLRLALYVSKGWSAVARDDGQQVTLRGEGAAVEYSKLFVRDDAGRVIPSRLTVAEEQVVIEVEDHEATYPLTIDPTFTLQQKLTAADGESIDRFGSAVAIYGDTVAVGAEEDDIGATADQGSVYIFTRSGATWALQQKLTAFDGIVDDMFGQAVAIYGDTLAVGAPTRGGFRAGSVYVFTRSGATWTLQQKIAAFDGAADNLFGCAVALSDFTLVAGSFGADIGANNAQGAVYVYTRIGAVWSLQKKITAGDGSADDFFGIAVALSVDTLAVGARSADVGSNQNQGSVYVFQRYGTIWLPEQKLTASDGAAGDLFGTAVALGGDTLAVGASRGDVSGIADQGSAYVFTRSDGVWSLQQKLTANDGAMFDYFGDAVALSGDMVVVGAHEDDIGANSAQGSAYVFTRSGGIWTLQQKITAGDGAAFDHFGAAVALSGDTLAAGAYADDIGANAGQGSAYVFSITVNPPPCSMLTIDPPALPDGVKGAPYSVTLTAIGGVAPYQFGVNGKFPPGMSLSANGVLSGASTQAGNFKFTVTVSDARGCTGSRAYSIAIKK